MASSLSRLVLFLALLLAGLGFSASANAQTATVTWDEFTPVFVYGGPSGMLSNGDAVPVGTAVSFNIHMFPAFTYGSAPSGCNITHDSGDTWNATITETCHVTIDTTMITLIGFLSDAVLGEFYYGSIMASGGHSPLDVTLESGNFPAGITFSGGSLSGNPSETGSFSFTLRATDGYGHFTTQSFTLTVNGPSAAPTITSISPASGPGDGGTEVTITGTGLTGATAVTFDGAPVFNFTVDSDTQITAITSPHAQGPVDVAVTTPGGSATATGGFTYDAPVELLLSVNDVTVTEGNSGSKFLTFEISLNLPVPQFRQVTFDIATADDTATAGVDYVSGNATGVGFGVGNASSIFTVQTHGDTLDEPDETFFANVTNVVGATVVKGQGVGTIVNDDGLAGSTVSWSTGSGGSADITATAGGMALASGDSVPAGSVVEFRVKPEDGMTYPGAPLGCAVHYISSNAAGDLWQTDPLTADCAVQFRIAYPAIIPGQRAIPDAALGQPYVGVQFQTQSQYAPFDQGSWSQSGALPAGLSLSTAGLLSGTPQESGTFTFDLAFTNVAGHVIEAFNFAITVVSGNADLSALALSEGALTPGFGPGTTSYDTTVPHLTETITVTPTAVDPNATITVNSQSVTSGSASAAIPLTVGDTLVTVVVTAQDGTTTKTYTVNVTRENAPVPTITGIAPTDGTTAGGTGVVITGTNFSGATLVMFGVTPAVSFTVSSATQIAATTPAHAEGAVDVAVSTPGGSATAPGAFTYIAPALPPLSVSDATVSEGGLAVFTVALSAPAGPGGVTFDIATADGTAIAGADYTVSSLVGQTIPAGSSSYTFSVQTVADALHEPGETFSAIVTNVVGATLVDGEGVGTILDDDPQPELSIGSVSVNEGNAGATSAVFTVSLSAASGQPVTVSFATADGTALAGSDYVASNGVLEFTPGMTSDTIVVTVNGDVAFEADETFSVNLSNAVGATIAAASGIGTIVNDDVAAPTITGIAPISGTTEGGTSVVITGTNLGGATAVTFGGTGAASFTVDSATQITATTPAHAQGAVDVVVTTPDGIATATGAFTYQTPASNNASLSNLTVSVGTLNPAFAPGITDYTVSVPSAVTSLTLTPTAAYAGATISIGGQTVVSGSPSSALPLVVGDNTITVEVTAEDATTTRAYQVTVTRAVTTITIGPDALSDGVGGKAYGPVTLTAAGGTAPYVFAVTTGDLPEGLLLAATGEMTGTPVEAGSFAITVTAADDNGFTGTRNYTLVVDAPAITIGPDALSDGEAGSAYGPVTFTANGGTAPYVFAVTAGNLPEGLSLATTGGLTGTPTEAGSFPITVTATDDNGFTASRPFSLSIRAPEIDISVPSIPEGKVNAPFAAVRLSASGGVAPYAFSVTGGDLPEGMALAADGALSGTPTQGGDFPVTVAATDSLGFAGTANLSIRIRNFNIPVAQDLTLEVMAGTSGSIDLTQGATNGPFTRAAIAVHPVAEAGRAAIRADGAAYMLDFAATATFEGSASLQYTLSNTDGRSAPATVTLNVIARPDPSQDPEVIGLLTAQAEAAKRFARTQTQNFNQRLEQLHDEGERRRNSMNTNLALQRRDSERAAYAKEDERDRIRQAFDRVDAHGKDGEKPAPNASNAADDHNPLGRFAVWSGGFVNFAEADNGSIDLDSTLVGVSGGVDYRFTPKFVAGLGFGYGRDKTDVGANGTESLGQAWSIAAYGSYKPTPEIFIDGLIGYSLMNFDSRRYVTATGDFAMGSRDGQQVFGSLTAGYEHRRDGWLLSPYGRLEVSRSSLDAFTESGGGMWDLTYGDQTIDTLSGILGLRVEYAVPMDWGVFKPRARVEYAHDFEGSSRVGVGYADIGTLPYVVETEPFSKDHLTVGLGFDAQIGDGWTFGFDYRTAYGSGGRQQDHTFAVKVGAQF